MNERLGEWGRALCPTPCSSVCIQCPRKWVKNPATADSRSCHLPLTISSYLYKRKKYRSTRRAFIRNMLLFKCLLFISFFTPPSLNGNYRYYILQLALKISEYVIFFFLCAAPKATKRRYIDLHIFVYWFSPSFGARSFNEVRTQVQHHILISVVAHGGAH